MKKRSVGQLGAVLFSAAQFITGAFPAYALVIDGFEPDEQVVYKTAGTTELKLHVFNPENHSPSDRRPAIVFFFGGGWVGGSPTQFHPQCEYLAARGMVAMSAEYRVESVHGTTPRECVQDGKSAIRWIRAHAGELGIDPDQVVAGGGSAGGQIAAAAGTVSGFEEEGEDLSISSCPDALVLFNPVYDNGPTGWGYDTVQEYWEGFSPMHNINTGTPPTVVMLGTEDALIPVETAQEYKSRMELLGLRNDLYLYEGQGHGFFNYGEVSYPETIGDMDTFLVSLGLLEESTVIDLAAGGVDWNSASWGDPAAAPVAGHDYRVPNGWQVTVDTNGAAFAGDHLLLENSARLILRTSSQTDLITANVITDGGAILNGGIGAYQQRLGGTIENIGSGYSLIRGNSAPAGDEKKLIFTSTITGTGGFKINDADTAETEVVIAGDSSGFSGDWLLNNRAILRMKGTDRSAGFGSGNVEVLSGGKLQIEADCVAAGSLAVDSGATWVLHADGDALQFETVCIGGTPLAAGDYSFADLVANFAEVTGAVAGTLTVASSGGVESASILGIGVVLNNLVELTIDAPVPSRIYPKHCVDLVGGVWENVAHSSDGINDFVVTNLSYSTLSGSNAVIYVLAGNEAEFFGMAGE